MLSHHIYKQKRNQLGVGKLTLLIFGSIVFSGFYYAYNVLPFYYYFYELRSQFQACIRMGSEETDEEIRKRVYAKIDELEIPADKETLVLQRNGNRMHIRIRYREYFDIYWKGKRYNIQKFDFDADMEDKF